ncbi:hypothetical protein SELMODRAFT_451619 [Selaginella moellendorffii]|uniref:Uncharacterized protein ABI3C-1 n=1 Tax=Selaginella moellendorffii TaxID=88036 RepID=D8R649_SELML|nr:hypothetical protein SELMODRAFT_451619 [Selaginella moellendorffii]
MAVSCAVYNLPSDFPLLDVKIESVSISGREVLDCCDDFSFQDFSPIAQHSGAAASEASVAFDHPQKDPASIIPLEAPAPGFQLVDNYGGAAAATLSVDGPQDCKPLVDLWEVPDAKKESMASIPAGSSARLVEWIGEVPAAATMMDWQQHQAQQHHSIVIGDEESATASIEDQYWFSCPQLECQVLQSQQQQQGDAIGSSTNLYAFRRHCPAAILDNLMVASPQVIDGPAAANILDPVANIKVEQQPIEEHFHTPGGFLPGSDRQIKVELPFRSTARKCRMARKRRSLPYQVPFPCCTSRKSVEELIVEKNLEFLLQKQLKPSDVGNLGRIVLPKKEAESCLPYLTVREGMTIVMEDLTTAYKWHMRYRWKFLQSRARHRFWPNNKSRMYLLENTGEFIRSHCLKEGDLLRLYKYKNSAAGKYVILGKKAASPEDSSTSSDTNNHSNKRVAVKSSTRKRSKGCGGGKSNKVASRGGGLAEIAAENCTPSSSSRAGSSSGSFGSSEREGHGLANFDSFEASDIQEILTSLS